MDIKVVVMLLMLAYALVRYIYGIPMHCPQMPILCDCHGKPQYKTIDTRYILYEKDGEYRCTTMDNPFLVCNSYGCNFEEPKRTFKVPTTITESFQPSTDSFQTSNNSLQTSNDSLQTSNDSLQTSNDSLAYPVGYVIPNRPHLKRHRDRDMDPGHRDSRSAKRRRYTEPPLPPCYLKPLYSANVACWNWGYFYSCNVTCIPGYGHTVDNRSVRSWTTKCRFIENFWYPREYDDCEPVDRNCDVELTGSGTLICTGPTAEHRYCDIECYADIFRETGNLSFARYPCTENYANELPWCASVRAVSVIDEPDYPFEDIYYYTGNYA